MGKDRPRKSKDGERPKQDQKEESTKKAYVPKNKLKTEGVTELEYNRYSATSFCNFERDLKMVAGKEYGELFGYVLRGMYPPETNPKPKSVDGERERAYYDYEERIEPIELIPEPNRTQEQKDELQRLKTQQTASELYYASIRPAAKALMDLEYKETYAAERKEATAKREKLIKDKPCLYWLIRSNISETSLTKIKELAGASWEDKERAQDPVELWASLKETHTAYSTGNPHVDQQALRQSYADLKMFTGETLI